MNKKEKIYVNFPGKTEENPSYVTKRERAMFLIFEYFSLKIWQRQIPNGFKKLRIPWLFLQLKGHGIFKIPQENLKIQKSLYKFSPVFPFSPPNK